MDAQILLLKKRLVPTQSVHGWIPICGRWLNDKRQAAGYAVFRG